MCAIAKPTLLPSSFVEQIGVGAKELMTLGIQPSQVVNANPTCLSIDIFMYHPNFAEISIC
jgi:hypothetical protein